MSKTRLITVCDKCFRASCWHGIFMCDDAVGAGLVTKTVAELKKLNVEHPSHYSVSEVRKHTGCDPKYREKATK